MSNELNKVDFDVVIVGAGIVGAALASALGGSGLRVAIIEAREITAEWPQAADDVDGFDARVSAVTLASQQWLQQLGAWPAAAGQRVSPYRFMHVWDAEGTASVDFDAADVNRPLLGHIVENRLLAAALLQSIRHHANISLLAPVSIEMIEKSAGGYQLTADDGNTFNTALLVAADGARSAIRSMLNMPVREWDYGHDAIVATIETERGHRQTAWQRFLPEGPLAFLPLHSETRGDHLCSIVWSAVPAYADELMALSEADFNRQLRQAFEHQLGAVLKSGKRFRFPLTQRHAVDYVRPGLALIGDAAHTIHPLAGQGVNLGLSDARVLSEELLRALSRGLDVGEVSVLKRYQRRRKSDNLLMMAGMEGFKRLFEQDRLSVRWARNAGMRWFDQCLPLKRRIIRQAMGL